MSSPRGKAIECTVFNQIAQQLKINPLAVGDADRALARATAAHDQTMRELAELGTAADA